MDKSSSLVKTILNNEQIVERAEKIAEVLEAFENNKTIDNYSSVVLAELAKNYNINKY